MCSLHFFRQAKYVSLFQWYDEWPSVIRKYNRTWFAKLNVDAYVLYRAFTAACTFDNLV